MAWHVDETNLGAASKRWLTPSERNRIVGINRIRSHQGALIELNCLRQVEGN